MCSLNRRGGSLESVFLILNLAILSICSCRLPISFEVGLTKTTLARGECFGTKKQVCGGNSSEWGYLDNEKMMETFQSTQRCVKEEIGKQGTKNR